VSRLNRSAEGGAGGSRFLALFCAQTKQGLLRAWTVRLMGASQAESLSDDLQLKERSSSLEVQRVLAYHCTILRR